MTLDSSRYISKTVLGLCDIKKCIKDDIKDIGTFVTKVTKVHKYIDYIDKLSSNIIGKEENYKFLEIYLKKIYNSTNPPPDYLENKTIEVLSKSLSKVDNVIKSTPIRSKFCNFKCNCFFSHSVKNDNICVPNWIKPLGL